MGKTQQTPDACPSSEAAEIAKWTRVYARNRTLGVVVAMIAMLCLCVMIGGSSLLSGWAYRAGNMPVMVTGLVLLVVSLTLNVYLAVPRWGGRMIERITGRLYVEEGQVAFSSLGENRKNWGIALGLVFASCILISVALGFAGLIPIKYMQPVSALYMVPFLVCLTILMQPHVSYVSLLWPALYALHAVLIVAGAPIVFSGRLDGLNMLIPTVGYGILTALLGHLNSRIALRRLKQLATVDPMAADMPEKE